MESDLSSRAASTSTGSIPRSSLDSITRVADADTLAPLSPHLVPDSPSNSTFLRTAATLDGLARQLEGLRSSNASADDLTGQDVRCCCGALQGCRTWQETEKLEDKLKLSGEIGTALLQRYEALEQKLEREVERYEKMVEVKRTALAESLRHVSNLEKANHTHLQKYAEITKKNEALEKRYTQALHTQTLTQQSLTHVRTELTSLRRTTTRQNIALASGEGLEDRLMDAEKRYEEAKDLGDAEARKAREERRRRIKAEERIESLEAQLSAAARETDAIREARSKDAQDLLANAKERLEILHNELSETFHSESSTDSPEYHRALENLVANNVLLKHDVAELSHTLADSRDEVRALKEEIDDLRSVVGVAGRVSPIAGYRPSLAGELSRSTASHNRTESSPTVGTFAERGVWSRSSLHMRDGSVSSSRHSGGVSAWEHHRKSSMAPSFASSSTTGEGITSPGGLGMGPIGEYADDVTMDESSNGIRSPKSDSVVSPRPTFRSSPSGGIGYRLNGVPKTRPPHIVVPEGRRSFSIDRSRPGMRPFALQATDNDIRDGSVDQYTEEPLSPGAAGYFRAAEVNRKRASLILSRRPTMSPRDSTDISPNPSGTMVDQSTGSEIQSPMSDPGLISPEKKRVHRRTLLLLSQSRAVQTDPVEILGESKEHLFSKAMSKDHSNSEQRSETSFLVETRISLITNLIDHLGKILTRIHSSDVRNLNKRLKRQHLPGTEIAHLSRSTMQKLQDEVSDLRHHFRGAPEPGPVSRKEFTLLLKMFKDVISDLIELQHVVNDITIDPALAKKLNRDAYREEEDDDGRPKAPRQSSGLGWIAAPITKFFVTPAADGGDADSTGSSPRAGRGLERGRLQPGSVRPASKQVASTSATTTYVSVEFGGSGLIRKTTPSQPANVSASQPVIDGLPPSPHGMGDTLSAAQLNRSATPTSNPPMNNSLAPPTTGATGTLRPSRSRANRNELLGIFAGAPTLVSPTDPWVVMPGKSSALGTSVPSAPRIRSVSSQQFSDRTIRPPRDAANRKRLSAIVDAVIDTSAGDMENDDNVISGQYDSPVQERRLRPRGLSDSSIRSTFQSHANPGESMISPPLSAGAAARATAYGAVVGRQPGMLESLSRKFYSFRSTSNEVTPVNPDPTPVISIPSEVTANSELTLNEPASQPVSSSPPRPIPTKAATTRPGATSPTTTMSSSMTAPSGMFGYFASSLAGATAESTTTVDGGEEDAEEFAGASLRYPALVSRSVSRGPATGKGSYR